MVNKCSSRHGESGIEKNGRGRFIKMTICPTFVRGRRVDCHIPEDSQGAGNGGPLTLPHV